MKIKGGADTDHDRGIDFAQVVGHPEFLFGSAQADPDDIGIGSINLIYREVVFFQ